MANIYVPDDSDSFPEDEAALSVSSGRQSAVLIASDGSDEEVIDVEAASQPLVIQSNSNSPVLINDGGSSTDELTDFGSETEDENEAEGNRDTAANRTEVIFRAVVPEPSAQSGTPGVPINVDEAGPSDAVPSNNTDQIYLRGDHNANNNAQEVSIAGPHVLSGIQSLPSGANVAAQNAPNLPSLTISSSPARNVNVPIQANSPARLNSSIGEFRSPKRRRIESPAKKVDQTVEIDEEAECCPICFEQWSNSGSHRLSSLKCGHLFGQACIERWLKGQGGKCPQCNAKATRKDIRVIYAKALRALDTSERDRALKDLEAEKLARQKVELELAQFRVRFQLSNQEIKDLQRTISEQRLLLQQLRSNTAVPNSQLTQSSTNPSSSAASCAHSSEGYAFDRIIKIWEAGNCRVMAYSPHLATLVISQPSATPLFPGFGIKKLNCLDFKTSQYVSIHSKPIRDLAFNTRSADGLLLSCSMDKTVKMTSLNSNTVVQSYNCTMPVWSCVWNSDDKNYFFAGQQNGVVCMFDTRNTETYVEQLNTEGSRSPVVSLQYVDRNPNAPFRPGGLLVGQLDRIMFYEMRSDAQFRPHMFPSDGTLASLSLEEKTRHILASFRPSSKHPHTRHQLCELSSSSLGGDPQNQICTSNAVQTFQGGKAMKQLTRARLIHHPSLRGQLLVCAPDEASCMLQIWDCSSGLLKRKIPTHQPVIDVCPLTINDEHYVAALTDKVVRLHKWS